MNKLTVAMLLTITVMSVAYAADDEMECNRKKLREYIQLYRIAAKTAEEEYQEQLQTYPGFRASEEIRKALIEAETNQHDKALCCHVLLQHVAFLIKKREVA